MFEFRLASILRVRRRLESEAWLERQRLLARKRAIEVGRSDIRAQRCDLTAAIRAGGDAALRVACARSLHLRAQAGTAVAERNALERDLARAHERLVTASRARLALERLRDRQRAAYEVTVALREQRELEESNACHASDAFLEVD